MADSAHESSLVGLFALVARQTGCDFSHYKPTTLGRRIQQRLIHVGCPGLEAYREHTERHPEEALALQRHLLIGVTSFFRNGRAFDRLRDEWEAGWKDRAPGPVRVWAPACSTGEEAYSLAILFREFLDRVSPSTDLKIFATDLSSEAVESARRGCYPDSVVERLGPDRLNAWFEREARGWRVRKQLRDHITFAVHNVLADPPFAQLDVVSCRNLFIYLNPEAQGRAAASLAFALKPGGLLLMGTSETVDPHRQWFDPLDKKVKLYRRRPKSRLPVVPQHTAPPRKRMESMPASTPPPRDLTVKELVFDLIARDYAIPSVLVDAGGNIQFVWGDTSPLFRRRTGRPTDQVVENVVDSLQVGVAGALASSVADRRTVVAEGFHLPGPDGRPVRITVRPVEAPVLGSPHFLIVFQVLEVADRVAVPSDSGHDRRVEELERELNDTRLYLHNLVLKVETANEELAAGNEETQSMNEELQSSNEELESSREELQIANAELESVNAASAKRIAELAQLNNDWANLIASARLGIVFLDRQLAIQRFTPEVLQVLPLEDKHLGRRLPDVARSVLGGDLEDLLTRVLRDLIPEERELTAGHRTIQLRVLPYRTLEDKIEGLVLTLNDLTELRAAEAERGTVLHEFQVLFQANPFAILLGDILGDASGRVIDVRVRGINPTFEHWVGRPSASVEGRTASELKLELEPSRFEVISRAFATGRPQTLEGFQTFGQQQGRHVKITAIALGGVRFALLIDDISESVRQQQALKEGQALFHSTLTSMDDFVSAFDSEGRYVEFFQAHLGDLYLGPEAIIGRRVDELGLPPDVLAAHRDAFEAVKAGAPVAAFEYTLPYPSGGRWFSARMSPRLGAGKRFEGAVLVARDITNLVQAQTELKEREAQLRAVFEASPLGLFLSRDGTVIRANQALQNMFGGEPLNGLPLRRLSADTATIPVRVDLVDVEPGVQVGVAQDLSERQRMERTALNSQRLESLGVLAGGIAHDFNNLLGGLFGFIELALKATPEDAPSHRHLARALSAFGRAQDLTRQLLTFSKGGEPVKKALDLTAPLLASARFVLAGANVKLEIELPEDLWWCEVDPHQLGQVIDNLGMNARQAMPGGGTLWLSARNVPENEPMPAGLTPGPYVAVTFADDGPGIAPEVLPRIFDPFFSTKREGSGLGLATVYSILRKHGGLIEVASRPGEGARFSLWFPALPPSARLNHSGPARLLVLDDEELILETAVELSREFGYDAVGVRDGASAVETFRQGWREGRRFGFFLTDLTLPGEKGGLAVLEQLRQLDPALKAAASSGYSDDPVMAAPSARGLEGFLPKPYTRDQLKVFLEKVYPLNGPR
jgi:two-component system CheB/CheR fusion protein